MTPSVKQIVETALDLAKTNLANINEEFVQSFRMWTQMPTKAAREMQITGNWLQEASRIVVQQNGPGILDQIDNDEVQSMISSSTRRRRQTSKYENGNTDDNNKNCIKDDTNCGSKKNFLYRTITGICNNLNNPRLASANAPIRFLMDKPSYDNEIGTIRSSVSDGPLPSTRLISNIMQDSTPEKVDPKLNNLHMQFGQIVAHDIILTPSASGPNGEQFACDNCSSPSPVCAPIEIPEDDQYFPPSTPNKKNCLAFTRVLNAQQRFGPRQPIGQNTHFLDLSLLYGSSECEATSVRAFVNGLMLVQQSMFGPLPPPAKNITRRIMIAQYQHIVYNEYLSHVLGSETFDKNNLKPLTNGRTSYDETVNAGMIAEFVAGAYRFGHSQARKDFPRDDAFNNTIAASVNIGDNGFYTESQYKNGGPATFVTGMMFNPTMSVDTAFAFPIRNQIFEIRGKRASGTDLVATNLMRGRDIGLHPYVSYREMVGLPPVNNFDDLVPQMGQEKVNMLKRAYRDVRDVDLYAGILSEKHLPGAIVGQTAATIIAKQFKDLKLGDRFYYEHAPQPTLRGLTSGELAEIRRSTLGGIICRAFPMDILRTRCPKNKFGIELECAFECCESLEGKDHGYYCCGAEENHLVNPDAEKKTNVPRAERFFAYGNTFQVDYTMLIIGLIVSIVLSILLSFFCCLLCNGCWLHRRRNPHMYESVNENGWYPICCGFGIPMGTVVFSTHPPHYREDDMYHGGSSTSSLPSSHQRVRFNPDGTPRGVLKNGGQH